MSGFTTQIDRDLSDFDTLLDTNRYADQKDVGIPGSDTLLGISRYADQKDVGITGVKTNDGLQFQVYSKTPRVNGWAIAGFHVLNLFGGVAGAVGRLCADSQCMGSEKMNSTKCFGQLYLAATHEKSDDGNWMRRLKLASKGWSVLAKLICSPVKLMQNKFGPGMRLVKKLADEDGLHINFGCTSGLNDSLEVIQRDVSEGMKNELKQARETKKKSETASQDAARLRATEPIKDHLKNTNGTTTTKSRRLGRNKQEHSVRDYKSDPVRVCCSTGSSNLKKCFLLQAQKQFDEEIPMFLEWSSKTLAQMNPQSIDYQPDARLSRKQMLQCYQGFVRTEAPFELNLPSKMQSTAVRTMDPDTPGSLLSDYARKLQQVETELKNAQSAVDINAPGADDRLKIAKLNLKNINEETFEPGEQKEIIDLLTQWDDEVAKLAIDVEKKMISHSNLL